MSSQSLKHNIKQLIPPLLISVFKKGNRYEWKGNYESWEAASKESGGYHAANILERVKQSTLKVKKGEAAYERDGVLFEKIQYSWPLLSALMWAAAQNKGRLHVADVGGGLGSSYFQNKVFLDPLSDVQWNIIEQKTFSDCGRKFFSDPRLQFFDSLADCISKRSVQDILVLSCVLPYLEQPYEALREFMGYKAPFIIIDNTYFNIKAGNRICIQKVPPDIYEASYPCWFLDYEEIKATTKKEYTVISEHVNDSIIYLDGKKIQYRGLLLKRNQ